MSEASAMAGRDDADRQGEQGGERGAGRGNADVSEPLSLVTAILFGIGYAKATDHLTRKLPQLPRLATLRPGLLGSRRMPSCHPTAVGAVTNPDRSGTSQAAAADGRHGFTLLQRGRLV
ncbi:hypothetical protein ACFQ69_25155 [Streptomyces sp. NPDC056470]|uniref:hypothetical protein n=1 Tax=Streptomyces sp. NPDC056470 TaxID=3345831 RepID=UPI0036A9B612